MRKKVRGCSPAMAAALSMVLVGHYKREDESWETRLVQTQLSTYRVFGFRTAKWTGEDKRAEALGWISRSCRQLASRERR
jgi:hypothetical protein